MDRKIRLVLAIRSLDVGGAERQFIELVKGIDKNRFEVMVCTMYKGRRDAHIEGLTGVNFVHLHKQGRYDVLRFGLRYKKLLKAFAPDVIYAFLGEMSLFSLWCKPAETKVIWGIRASNMRLHLYGLMPRLLFRLQKELSSRVDAIVTNSRAAVDFHAKVGFDMRKAEVIYNGIDIQRFKPDAQARREFRLRYNVQEDETVIGIAARLDPMKGYPIFARAIQRLLQEHPKLKIFSAGTGSAEIKRQCEAILGAYDRQRFIWLGEVDEMASFYNGLDLYVSSSLFGEGFSNSVAEAMACGIACVVTDVGDSAVIVGETGWVVLPGDADALYRQVKAVLGVCRNKRRKAACRDRITQNFSIEKMVRQSEEVVRRCAAL